MLRLHRALILLLPAAALADVVVPVEIVEQHVNIRMTPDAKSEIVGRLPQGEWRTVVDAIEGWYEVEIAGGATGFISADWTVRLDAPPEPEATAPAADRVVAERLDAGTESTQASAEVPAAVESSETEKSATLAMTASNVVAEATEKASVVDESMVNDVVAEPVEGTPDQPPVADIDSAENTKATRNDVAGPVAEVIDVSHSEVDTLIDEDAVQAQGDTAPLPPGPTGPAGPAGPQGPPGPAGGANIEGSVDYLMKFTAPTIGGNSQVYDDGNHIGIGTTEPKQRLEVNGNIQIHEQNSSVAGLMITQSSGETGYIMHNRASTLTIGAGSVDRITIDRDGNIGFGTPRPAHPLELANGAYVTDGGVWTNASSRELKENIAALDSNAALAALAALEPVQFNYKDDATDGYVGFIAEDVPALVASGDRKGLSAMDIVAVLTRVVQDQQKKIEELEAKLDQR